MLMIGKNLTLIFLNLFIITCLFKNITEASPTTTITDAQILKLARSKSWLRLLYYKNNKSEVDNPKFFLSPEGKKNPTKELKASITAFFPELNSAYVKTQDTTKMNDESAICQFPARFFFLQKELGLNQLNKLSQCKKLNEFLARLQGQSVSLIFSSYYINNPSSAFGHTFIKINKNDDLDLDLLNYGINYAATTNTKNAFFYALKGLIGFFPGEFTAVPYYYKVREYNDYESRDLWEYKLDFSPQDILFLNLHIWELGQAWSWYYFLSKNCSYWAIRVLEAVRPDLDLEKNFRSGFVIPIETVKSLYKHPGFIKDIKHRPSLRSKLLDNIKNLNTKDAEKLEDLNNKLTQNKITIEELKKYSPNFLDTLILYYDYVNAKDYIENEDKILQNKKPLLQARSELPITDKTQFISINKPPHLAHPPKRISLGYKFLNQNNLPNISGFNFRYKEGFHEILDSKVGFNPHMGLNYFDFSILFFDQNNLINNKKILLDYFHLISIDSFTSISKIESPYSWRLKVGYDSELILNSWDQKVGFLIFDTGIAKSFFNNEDLLVFLLVSNNIEANGRYSHTIRYSIGPAVGFKLSLSENTIALFEAKPLWSTDFESKNFNSFQSSLKLQTYINSLKLSLLVEAKFLKLDQNQNTIFSSSLNYYF